MEGKNKLSCNLIGHKTDKDYNDSGYLVCKRCGSHQYYDNNSGAGITNRWQESGYLFYPIFWIKWQLFDLKLWWSYKFNNNKNLPF